MTASIGTALVSEVIGSVRLLIVPVTFDNSYPTGGEAVDFKANNALTTIIAVTCSTFSGGGVNAHYDADNAKLIAFYQDGDTGEFIQVTSTDDISAETVLCTVYGR